MCFDSKGTKCVGDMIFLTVNRAMDTGSLKGSGLIGLAPTPSDQKLFDQPGKFGVPGFIAQLQKSGVFHEEFDPVFSLYLSNDVNVKGKIIFGGADYKNLAKKGLGEKDVFWMQKASNPNYWTVQSTSVSIGGENLVQRN
jgi:hypothetical protein